MPTHYPNALDLALLKRVTLQFRSIKTSDSHFLAQLPDPTSTMQNTNVAIEALTSYLHTVIRDSTRKALIKDLRMELPDYAKRAASRAYIRIPPGNNRVRVRSLKRQVRSRIREVKGQNWSITL